MYKTFVFLNYKITRIKFRRDNFEKFNRGTFLCSFITSVLSFNVKEVVNERIIFDVVPDEHVLTIRIVEIVSVTVKMCE